MLRARIQATLSHTLGPLTRMSPEGRVLVLCYHSVHPQKDFAVTPEKFAGQLAWLKQHCTVIPFTHALTAKPGPRPQVALTFDDGYADNHEYAFPILARHGLSATFFLTAGLMEREPAVLKAFEFVRNSDFETIRPMTWQQVEEMRAGGQEFGAHTWSHPNLAELSYSACLDELVRSKQILEQKMHAPVNTLAYPFGLPGRNFTEETVRAAQEAGYTMACAVHYRPVLRHDSPFAVPRFSVLDEELDVFAQKIKGNWDYLGWWQEHAPAWFTRRAGGRQPIPRGFVDSKIVEDRPC